MTGGTACEGSTWQSSSGVVCKVSAGSGGGSDRLPLAKGMPVVVSVGLQQGSQTQSWSYDASTTICLSDFDGHSSFPSSASIFALIHGLSLGIIGYSGTVRVGQGSLVAFQTKGSTACEGSVWQSDSSIICKIGSGLGDSHVFQLFQGIPVFATVGLQQGSQTRAMSYDTSTAIDIHGVTNGPASGSVSLTILGSGFGSFGYSGRAREKPSRTPATVNVGPVNEQEKVEISCSPGVIHRFVHARYGDLLNTENTECQEVSEDVVTVASSLDCVGQVSCNFVVSNSLFSDTCPNNAKQFEARVQCAPSFLDFVGGTAFEVSTWTASSVLVCKLGAGSVLQSYDVPLIATFGLQQAILTKVWSYCSPAVSLLSALNFNPASQAATAAFNAPATGFMLLYISGSAFGSSSPSSSASFAATSLPSTSWTSSSHLLARLSPGFVSKTPNLIVSAALTTSSISSVLSYDPPLSSVISSSSSSSDASLNNVSISGSNFGTSVALLDRNVVCEGVQSIEPGQSREVCSSDKLLEDLGASVIEAIFGITFENVTRFDDVSVSIVSPRLKEFYLLRDNCFGYIQPIECDSLPNLRFVFPILPFTFGLWPHVPTALCTSQGVYSAPNISGPFDELSATTTALGRWSVKVYAGSQHLNVKDVSIQFKTSSLNVYIGVTPASSFAWTSDSSMTAAVPGFQPHHKQSASGWGHNHSISSNGQTCRSCMFSYPDPEISNVSSPWPSTGSSGIRVSGYHFANVNPSLRSRVFGSASTRSVWMSDTSVTCFAPSKVLMSFSVLSVSMGPEAIALFSHDLVFQERIPLIVSSNAPTAFFATTGSCFASVAGLNFGMWDSTLRARVGVQVQTAAIATRWLQDSVISLATKGTCLLQRQTLSLTFASTSYTSSLSSAKVKRSFNVAPDTFISTGAQILSITGSQFGTDSKSSTITILRSAAPFSVWVSDSSALCKSSAGSASSAATNTSVILSVDRSVSLSQPQTGSVYAVQTPCANSVNISNSTGRAGDDDPVSVLLFAITGLGCADPRYKLLVEKVACNDTIWASDSSMSCLYTKPVSKDRVQLQIDIRMRDEYDTTPPPISSTLIPNPALVPSSSPIATSFMSAIFLPMPHFVRERVDSYAGPVNAPPDFCVESNRTVYRYAEILDIDVLFYCNHTQVYLKNFLPYAIDIRGNFSIVNTQNGAQLSDAICDGSLALFHALPSNSFATVSRTSLVVCPKRDVYSAFLRLKFVVMNETGAPIEFTVDSDPFELLTSTTFIALAPSSSSQTPFSEYVAGTDVFNHAFVIESSASCGRIAVQYIATLQCLLANGTQSSATPYYINRTRSITSLSATAWSLRTCTINISGWVFFAAGTCKVALGMPMFPGTVLQSPSFAVVGGLPSSLRVSGNISSRLQEGDAIRSLNASISNCLSVFLFDEFNNSVPKCQNSFEISAVALNETHETVYALFGPTSGVSDCKGTVSWCDTRTPSPATIRLSVLSPWFNTTLSAIINVSGQGQPARIMVMSNVTLNQSTLSGGASIPPITIQLTNAVGKPLSSITTTVVIRIRIVPKATANISSSRSLLSDGSDAACGGGDAQYLNYSSVQGSIVVENVVVCSSGENEIFYDIGTYDESGSFAATALGVFSAEVSVQPGPAACFRFVTQNARLEQTYRQIESDIVVEFTDQGRNVVQGNTSIVLISSKSNARVAAKGPLQVSSRTSNISASRLGSFCIVDVIFDNFKSTSVAFITATGFGAQPLTFIGEAVALNISALCSPGEYVNLGLRDINSSSLGEYLLNTNRSQLCTRCSPGSVSFRETHTRCSNCSSGTYASADNTRCVSCTGNTWSLAGSQDSCLPCPLGYVAVSSHDRCITLTFSSPPPSLLTTVTPFALPSIIALDNFNVLVSERNGTAVVSLLCLNCTALKNETLLPDYSLSLIHGVSPPTTHVLDVKWGSDDYIGGGFAWSIASQWRSGDSEPNIVPLGIRAVYDASVAHLGPLPSIVSITTSLGILNGTAMASYAGDTVVSIKLSQWSLLPRMQSFAINGTSARCRFSLTSDVAAVLEVVSTAGDDPTVRKCVTPQAQPMRVWAVTAILADSRVSATSADIRVVCPNSTYLQNGSCVRCPSNENGRSFNEVINAVSVDSCRCDIGSYGAFGSTCKRCPLLNKGFSCSVTDLQLPMVMPGFYGDYSLLSSCLWTAQTCSALTTCPFGERSCPGGGEKLCTQTDDECYQGRACSSCCSLFYSESGRCHKCPDASSSTALLAIMTVVVVLVAVLLSTASSPGLTQSIKYFVLGMNFYQNLFSIKLINIEWPQELLQMFTALKFFSFSISAVRPECSFSWTFETKIIVTLILPIALSFVVVAVGIMYGSLASWRLHKDIQKLRSEGVQLPFINFASLCNCWLHVVFFRPVAWKPQFFMWFALSPFLEGRALGRKIRTGDENWRVLRTTLKSRFATGRIFAAMGRSRKVQPIVSDYDLKDLQSIVHGAGLDARFQGIVYRGRKFLSGILSISVLSFVGTLTSALSSTICEDRDGIPYLVQEPTIECSLSSTRYRTLLIVTICAAALYAVVLPLFVLLLLRSRWCLSMRSGDRGGYDALFGFLTSRYNRKCHMWEIVMFVYKALCVAIPAVNAGAPLQQSVGMMFVSLTYVTLLFKFSPFANEIMNAVEKATNFTVFLMYFTAVIFVCEVNGRPILDSAQKSVVGVFLVLICGASTLLCTLSAVYEYAFLMLYHGDIILSKWVQATLSAIGDSVNENLFLYFYVLYNPVSRSNILDKKMILKESAIQLKLLKDRGDVVKASAWEICVGAWRWLRFGFRSRHLWDCLPSVMREAMQYPEAQLLQRLSKIENHMHLTLKPQQAESAAELQWAFPNGAHRNTDRCASSFRFLQKLAFWKNNSIENKPQDSFDIAISTDLDPPIDFMESFAEKHEFVTSSFSAECIAILLTIMVFDDGQEMGSSLEARAYLRKMLGEVSPLKRCIRRVHALVEELVATDKMAVPDDRIIPQVKHKVVQLFKDAFLGSEGACLTQFATQNLHDVANRFAEIEMETCSEDSGSEIKAERDVVSAQASSSSPQDSSFLPSPDALLPPTLRPRLKYNQQLQLMPSSNQCPSTESASENSDDQNVYVEHDVSVELDNLRRSQSMLQVAIDMKNSELEQGQSNFAAELHLKNEELRSQEEKMLQLKDGAIETDDNELEGLRDELNACRMMLRTWMSGQDKGLPEKQHQFANDLLLKNATIFLRSQNSQLQDRDNELTLKCEEQQKALNRMESVLLDKERQLQEQRSRYESDLNTKLAEADLQANVLQTQRRQIDHLEAVLQSKSDALEFSAAECNNLRAMLRSFNAFPTLEQKKDPDVAQHKSKGEPYIMRATADDDELQQQNPFALSQAAEARALQELIQQSAFEAAAAEAAEHLVRQRMEAKESGRKTSQDSRFQSSAVARDNLN